MDYLQYVDGNTFLHRLDPRTKFVFLLAMAVLTSVIKSGVALLFLLIFFLILWTCCGIMKEMGQLLNKLKVLLIFIFLLWLIMGIFEEPPVELFDPFYKGQIGPVSICFDWYDIYKGFVYSLRIYLMIASFYTVMITTNFSEIILGLCKWHVPYSIAFAVGLVFQIIPIVIGELNSIMEAQSSRGLEIEQCKWYTKVPSHRRPGRTSPSNSVPPPSRRAPRTPTLTTCTGTGTSARSGRPPGATTTWRTNCTGR